MPPTSDHDLLILPQSVTINVSIEPVHNLLYSLILLNKHEKLSGVNEWVDRTVASLSAERRHLNLLVCEGLHYAILPDRRWPSFPLYLENLAASEPTVLRDRLMDAICRPHVGEVPLGARPPLLADPQQILASVDAYLSYLQNVFPCVEIDIPIETETHALLNDPPRMQAVIVEHLKTMWGTVLAPEWQRVLPMLQEAVHAFQHIDLSKHSALEAARLITGQELQEKWERMVAESRQIIFVPSPHIGPYLGKYKDGGTTWIVFGARLPEGVPVSNSALSRSDLLVRLSALNDDTRLRMLALLGRHEELCAQDIMTALDLSQSAASRHLRQLSATGYITERRREAAKCYSLNRERIDDTFRALSQLLEGE